MKNSSLLILIFFLFSCGNSGPIDATGITIEKTENHPILSDNCRILRTKNTEGQTIDEQEIYCDPGSGCDVHLFENGDDFTLIDCNGQWYSIQSSSGIISKEDWSWMKVPPGKCLFRFSGGTDAELSKSKLDAPILEEIYQFKDPG